MKLSRYFAELLENYHAEIEDLRHDSEGRDVLQSRLKDKRKAIKDLLPMIDVAPEMVAPAFHRAFEFPAGRLESIRELLSREPGEFLPWGELAQDITIAGWAQSMVQMVLEEPSGEDFLSTTVGLEYALASAANRAAPESSDERFDEGEDADEEADSDNESLGEDFLEQQGFDRRSPK